MRRPLGSIAHARSGDKGDTANIGVIAFKPEHYAVILREVTPAMVKKFFGDLVKGEVERFELPNLCAVNLLLHESLGGGGTVSLRIDAQGKTYGAALLRMEVEKLIDVVQDGLVLRVALNRPEKRNALNLAMCEQLLDTLERAGNESAIGAILLSGNGPVFCAGMDLKDSLEADPAKLASVHQRLFSIVGRIRKPVVAAVRGAALAAGAGLAANAHIVVAHPPARFALTEIRIGLWPVMIFRAMELAVGVRRATELSLTGRDFTASEALQYGLISEIADDPEKRGEIAAQLCESSPLAISTGLEFVQRIRGHDWETALRIGGDLRDRLLMSDNYKEGVRNFLRR